MRIELTRDWCMRMAALEADTEIGVGPLAIDPVLDGEKVPALTQEEPGVAFGRFVRLMRRDRGLTIGKLAEDAAVEVVELVSIEESPHYKPESRTVYRLATFFGVPGGNLMQVAGLTVAKDSHLIGEAMRFAARSESIAVLTPEERSALEAFVAVLSEKK